MLTRQRYDASGAKHYNYFRDYDPSIGRYVESDPMGMLAGPNTYAYVSGNPIAHFDIWGLCVWMGWQPTAQAQTEYKYEEVEIPITSWKLPNVDWKNPKCDLFAFFPPLPGMPIRPGFLPPCKPDIKLEDWDVIVRGMRRFARDYVDGVDVYQCDPEGCDGKPKIVKQARRKTDLQWRPDGLQDYHLEFNRHYAK